MKAMTIIPLVSEQAYAQSLNNVYVFRVPLTLNKNEIREAVQSQFDVTVTSVKTLVQDGKAVRFSRGKNRYPGTTKRKDWKKAYVTLKDGDNIKVFPADIASFLRDNDLIPAVRLTDHLNLRTV